METTNYKTSDSIGELAKALSKAQAAMRGAIKDAMNPAFRSKYADLAACWDACREPLTANGLSIVQPVSADGERVTVTTILLHDSGQFISSDLSLRPVKSDPQGIGSAVTYGRRYGLSAAVGIAPEDDDGNAASGHDERGSRKAQEQVAERKLAEMQPREHSQKTKDAFAALKEALGESLYSLGFEDCGYKSLADVPVEKTAVVKVHARLGEILKIAGAAKHGELLPGITQQIFERLPDESVTEVLRQYRAKMETLCGKDVGSDEYERLRGKAADRWTFVNALETVVKKMAKEQGIA